VRIYVEGERRKSELGDCGFSAFGKEVCITLKSGLSCFLPPLQFFYGKRKGEM